MEKGKQENSRYSIGTEIRYGYINETPTGKENQWGNLIAGCPIFIFRFKQIAFIADADNKHQRTSNILFKEK